MIMTTENDDMLQTIQRSRAMLKKKSDRLHRIAGREFESVGWIVQSWTQKPTDIHWKNE